MTKKEQAKKNRALSKRIVGELMRIGLMNVPDVFSSKKEEQAARNVLKRDAQRVIFGYLESDSGI